jgi:hypothetical protein
MSLSTRDSEFASASACQIEFFRVFVGLGLHAWQKICSFTMRCSYRWRTLDALWNCTDAGRSPTVGVLDELDRRLALRWSHRDSSDELVCKKPILLLPMFSEYMVVHPFGSSDMSDVGERGAALGIHKGFGRALSHPGSEISSQHPDLYAKKSTAHAAPST